MKKFFQNLFAYLWTPFNRDDLWNLSLNGRYCTYNPLKVKKGMIFCHVQGITIDHRMKTGTALKVTDVLDKGKVRVEIPFVVAASDQIGACESTSKFDVYYLDENKEYKVGDYFLEYGQYVFDGVQSNGIRLAHQINTKSEHVFKEPFIDFSDGERE